MKTIGVALLGTGFIADIHMECYQRYVRGASVEAVVGRDPEKTRAFAERHSIPHYFTDLRQACSLERVHLVDVCVPNYLHAETTVVAAEAGKHVICEKPLCMDLSEADDMIAACKRAQVHLMYAEELCFTPKYVRAKGLVDEGVPVKGR